MEGKKILAYEEGGYTSSKDVSRSAVALVIASSAAPRSTTVEAYCIAINGGSEMLCLSNVILGAALYHPPTSFTTDHSLPYVVTISKDVASRYIMDVEDLNMDESGNLVRGNILASTILDMGIADVDGEAEPPSMSMGSSPEALICCHDGFVTCVLRRKGLVFAYDFSSRGGSVDTSDCELVLVGKSGLGQYIVDAAIRSFGISGDEVELVLLLCENEDAKDGRIATVAVSRDDGNGASSAQYLSSI